MAKQLHLIHFDIILMQKREKETEMAAMLDFWYTRNP